MKRWLTDDKPGATVMVRRATEELPTRRMEFVTTTRPRHFTTER